jgi:hypothetical protein
MHVCMYARMYVMYVCMCMSLIFLAYANSHPCVLSQISACMYVCNVYALLCMYVHIVCIIQIGMYRYYYVCNVCMYVCA